MLIGSAAHFQVSPSQLHGRIITAGGFGTPNLSSIEQALLTMDKGVELGIIIDVEVPELRRQILESPLPRYHADVKPLAQLVADIEDVWDKATGYLGEVIDKNNKPPNPF